MSKPMLKKKVTCDFFGHCAAQNVDGVHGVHAHSIHSVWHKWIHWAHHSIATELRKNWGVGRIFRCGSDFVGAGPRVSTPANCHTFWCDCEHRYRYVWKKSEMVNLRMLTNSAVGLLKASLIGYYDAHWYLDNVCKKINLPFCAAHTCKQDRIFMNHFKLVLDWDRLGYLIAAYW